MHIIDKLTLIEIWDGKILSIRSKGETRYYFPDGKRKPGEGDFEPLSREIREELNVSLDDNSLKFTGVLQA